MKQIDTRGYSCPQPVIMVVDEIKNGNENFEILLDNNVSCENVQRIITEKYKLPFNVRKEMETTVYTVKR